MSDYPFSLRSGTSLKAVAPLLQFCGQSKWSKRFGNAVNCDFTIGKNPPDAWPGIGYLALPPDMPDRPLLREAIPSQQMLNSRRFPRP